MQSVNCSTWGPGFGVKWRCGLQPMLWAGRVPADLSRICTWGSRKELGIISCACLASHRRDQELTDTLIPDNYVKSSFSAEHRRKAGELYLVLLTSAVVFLFWLYPKSHCLCTGMDTARLFCPCWLFTSVYFHLQTGDSVLFFSEHSGCS